MQIEISQRHRALTLATIPRHLSPANLPRGSRKVCGPREGTQQGDGQKRATRAAAEPPEVGARDGKRFWVVFGCRKPFGQKRLWAMQVVRTPDATVRTWNRCFYFTADHSKLNSCSTMRASWVNFWRSWESNVLVQNCARALCCPVCVFRAKVCSESRLACWPMPHIIPIHSIFTLV